MPVQIKELIVTATIGEKENKTAGVTNASGFDEEAIVRRCVEQILKIMNRQKSR